jgi:hypothetical protein
LAGGFVDSDHRKESHGHVSWSWRGGTIPPPHPYDERSPAKSTIVAPPGHCLRHDREHYLIAGASMNTKPQSLVDQFVATVGLSRHAFAAVVVLLLALLLATAVFSQGGVAMVGPRGLWKMGLEPTLIVYILGIYPWLQRRYAQVIDALRPLSSQPEIADEVYAANRRGELIALFLGAAFSLWVTSSWRIEGTWIRLYLVTANIVLFSLMALAIYDGLARTRRLTRMVRAGLQLDLFDRQLLAPMARWGQTVALTFVGGICLSLIFQSYETLHSVRSLVIYSILIVVSLTLFFTSVWSIHEALVAAQQRELAVVHQHWLLARSELKRKLAEGGQDDIAGLYNPMVVLGAYESQVLAASTWPFNPKIVKEVLASLVAPFLIYGLKIAVGRLSGGN